MKRMRSQEIIISMQYTNICGTFLLLCSYEIYRLPFCIYIYAFMAFRIKLIYEMLSSLRDW